MFQRHGRNRRYEVVIAAASDVDLDVSERLDVLAARRSALALRPQANTDARTELKSDGSQGQKSKPNIETEPHASVTDVHVVEPGRLPPRASLLQVTVCDARNRVQGQVHLPLEYKLVKGKGASKAHLRFRPD